MQPSFTSEFFILNRQTIMQSLPQDTVVVVGGAGLMQRTADSSYAFVQNSTFWYLSGIEEPNIVLVMTHDESYCILPPTNDVLAVFDGSPVAKNLILKSGIKNIFANEEGWNKLKKDINMAKAVYVPNVVPGYDDRHGLYTNPAPLATVTKVKSMARKTPVDDTTFSKLLAYNRSVKQPLEIAAIEAAINLTLKGLTTVVEQYGTYQHEYEIEAELNKQFRLNGGNGHAFSPIVANGAHATTLHYVANNGALDHSLPTVIDVGADYHHYAADITRTLFPKHATQRHKDVYSAVERVQKHAIGLLKPGTTIRAYEQEVERKMAQELFDLNLITDLGDTSGIRSYFPHATSHFLGLDVHDVGLYDQPLEANMVLTCEPGIYIAKEQFGVRIEDDVLITKNGNRVLSA